MLGDVVAAESFAHLFAALGAEVAREKAASDVEEEPGGGDDGDGDAGGEVVADQELGV